MSLRSQIQKLAYWTIPGGVYNSWINYRTKINKAKEEDADPLLKSIEANIIFKDIHKGKRCFIVCNGPSINTQNLLLLQNEIVFSVSSGYHHPDYLNYQPAYHCLPPLSDKEEKITESVVLEWFDHKEYERRFGY